MQRSLLAAARGRQIELLREGFAHAESAMNKFAPPLDLFGEPIPPPRPPGRPRHVPTAETRRRVAQLHREGLDHVGIAAAIGITAPTLRLNYPSELESRSITACRRAARDHLRKD